MFRFAFLDAGGQRVVTGAEMMSSSLLLGGRHAQAFPSLALSTECQWWLFAAWTADQAA